MDTATAEFVSAGVGLRGRRVASRGMLHAFTLIELLVVISLISLLLAISLPALNAARERARRARCMANLHSIGQAITIYADENEGSLVPGDCVSPWGFWAEASEGDPNYRPVNLGHLVKAGGLPMPTGYDNVLFCPSARISYPDADPKQLARKMTAQRFVCITYMYDETLDGSTCGLISGKQARLAHQTLINYVRADGSAHAFHPGQLVLDRQQGPEDFAEVVARHEVIFPTSMVFRWLDRGSIDLAEALTYLSDPARWPRDNAESFPMRPVLLSQVGNKPLVADALGDVRHA